MLSEREQQCWMVFERGIQKVQTQKMWTLYAEALQQRLHRKRDPQWLMDQRIQHFLDMANRAADAKLISEAMCGQWVRIEFDRYEMPAINYILNLSSYVSGIKIPFVSNFIFQC